MTPHSVRRAAERKQEAAVKQTALHGAATPAPLPPEPEQPPVFIPLPDAAPSTPDSKPEPPQAPEPAAGQWEIFLTADESRDEFDAFFERLDDHYMPYNPEERVLVAKLAECRWSLHRRKRAVESIEAALYKATPDPAQWSEADFRRLAIADAYRLQAEKLVCRAQRNVEAFVRNRLEDSKWQGYFDLADRRFHLQRQKFAFTLQQADKRAKHVHADRAASTKSAVAS